MTVGSRHRLVVSAGLKKSGSGLMFNLLNELVSRSVGVDARRIRDEYGLDRHLRQENVLLGSLRVHRIAPLARPVLQGERFVVKTHAPPRLTFRLLATAGVVRPVLSIRDPRAIAASALSHGARDRARGVPGVMASVVTVDDAVLFAEQQVSVARRWMGVAGLVVVRYEDLVQDLVQTATDLSSALGLPLDAVGVARAAHASEASPGDLHRSEGRPHAVDDLPASARRRLASGASALGYATLQT